MVFSAPEMTTVSKPNRKPANAAVSDQKKIRVFMMSMTQEIAPKIFRLRKSLRNFPFESYRLHKSMKSGNF